MSFSIVIILVVILITLKNKDLGLMFSAIMMPMIGSYNLSPNIGVNFILSALFFFLYRKSIISFFREKGQLYKNIYILYVFIIILSVLIAPIKHVPSALQSICSFVIIPVCASICFRKKENLDKFVMIAVVCCICCIMYALYEFATDNNPIVEQAISQKLFNGELMTNSRFGIKQIQSFFSYHETAGCFFWMLAVFFMWDFLLSDKFGDKKKNYAFLIIFISSVCCFFTGSRSSIISLCIGLIPLGIANKKYFLLLPFIAILCFFFSPDYFENIYNSIIDSNDSSAGGSTSNMRMEQLEISTLYMLSSPNGVLVGNGFSFTDDFLIGKVVGLAGAESLWFRLMIDQGIIGILFMIHVFFYSARLSYKAQKYMFFWVLAFLCAKTVAVVPCVEVSWLFIFLIYFKYKQSFNKTFQYSCKRS